MSTPSPSNPSARLLIAALEHARRGRAVVALHSITPAGACTCAQGRECRTPGKHPRYHPGDLGQGILSATTDEARIREWWERWPGANIGVATGHRSGFWVLDVDPRHGGDETLHALEMAHGTLPYTVEQVTGSGGRHLFFALPESFEVRNLQRGAGDESPLGPGLDVRGEGGLIVAPGSLHASGRRYEWEAAHHPEEGTPVAAAPGWLLSKVREAVSRDAGPAPAIGERIPHGRQHDTLVSLAGSMRARGLEEPEIFAALWEVNQRRCEQPGPEENIRRIAASVMRYAPREIVRRPFADEEAPPASRAPAARNDGAYIDPPPAETEVPAEVVHERAPTPSRNGAAGTGTPEPAAKPGKRAPWVPDVIRADDLAALKLPPPQWVVPDIVGEGTTLLGGKPKQGKSWLALQTAIAVASGGMGFGKIPVQQRGVLYLGLEDTRRRLQARQDLLLDGQAPPAALMFCREWPRLDRSGKNELEKWLDAHPEIGLVIIDTLACIRPVTRSDGNIYEQDYAAIRTLKEITDARSASVLVVHHVRKGTVEDFVEGFSGSFGLSGAADTLIAIKRERGKADAILQVTGRDVEDNELALRWAPHSAWTLMGEAAEFRRSEEQMRVLDLLRAAGQPMTPAEVATALGETKGAIKVRMWRMAEAGVLYSEGGWYRPSTAALNEAGVHVPCNSCNPVTGEADSCLETG